MNLPNKAEFLEELSLNPKVTEKDKAELSIIYDFSLKHHLHAPKRATGEHYFWHIFRAVISLLYTYRLLGIWNVEVVKILLLHDTVEDAKESGLDPALVHKKIIRRFGNRTAYGTMAITKQGSDHSKDVLKRLVLLFYWYSLLAKCFDRNDNLLTLYGMKITAQLKKLAETEKYFPSIFNRLEAEIQIAVEFGRLEENWLKLVPMLRERQAYLIKENRSRLRALGIT